MKLGELLLHDGCINITEVFCDTARLYWISFEWGIFPSESWKFNADGTMIPEDRKRFMEENIEFGEEALNHLESLQNIAAEKIAKILRLEAEWQPETEEEQKARWVKEKKQATEKYLSETVDIKAALQNRMNN
jgi:hypothetical protein